MNISLKIIYELNHVSLIGNYEQSLSDAKAATYLQPTFLRAIERGKFLTK